MGQTHPNTTLPFGAKKLTPRLVAAIRCRMEAAMGALSVRAAALADTKNGVTDLVLAVWLTRGEELRAQGLSSADEHLPEYDRLCATLVELDGAVASRALLLAGEAMEDILVSRDIRTTPARVTLIKHVQASLGGDKFVPRQIVEHRSGDLDFTQVQMDALSPRQLERYEQIVRQRAALAEELRQLFTSAGAPGLESEAPTVH